MFQYARNIRYKYKSHEIVTHIELVIMEYELAYNSIKIILNSRQCKSHYNQKEPKKGYCHIQPSTYFMKKQSQSKRTCRTSSVFIKLFSFKYCSIKRTTLHKKELAGHCHANKRKKHYTTTQI